MKKLLVALLVLLPAAIIYGQCAYWPADCPDKDYPNADRAEDSIGKLVNPLAPQEMKWGPFKGYVEKNYSKKFKEYDYWQTGVSVGIEEGVSYGQKSGDRSASIGAKASARVEVFGRYDSDLNLTERWLDVDLAAEASVGAKTGNAAVDGVNPIHFKTGVDVHIEVIAGQDGSTRGSITASKQ